MRRGDGERGWERVLFVFVIGERGPFVEGEGLAEFLIFQAVLLFIGEEPLIFGRNDASEVISAHDFDGRDGLLVRGSDEAVDGFVAR